MGAGQSEDDPNHGAGTRTRPKSMDRPAAHRRVIDATGHDDPSQLVSCFCICPEATEAKGGTNTMTVRSTISKSESTFARTLASRASRKVKRLSKHNAVPASPDSNRPSGRRELPACKV